MKVVGIGASAGGIKALKELLENLPPQTGAAYVIIQHLSPDFKSIMEELLQKYTEMPVRQVKTDIMVEADHIYLIPSNKNLVYKFGMLKLETRERGNKLNLPIDIFFHSLGDGLKQDGIGVILSGSGTDGSRGARTIKEEEGIVLVQSPDTAEFDGMPNALINLDIADGILSPREIALKIVEIVKTNKELNLNSQELLQAERTTFEKIITLISEKSDIPFNGYKEATLFRRIEKHMILHEISSLKKFYDFINKDDKQIKIIQQDFLISVTRFFRDKEFFDELNQRVLPKIFDALPPEKPCRIWVAACSSGEEAYSIAMTVMEFIRKHELPHDFKIFASDVNVKSISLATKGIYYPSIAADIPLGLLEEYFVKEAECYRIKAFIREKIIFAVHNTITDPPFINMNLISCRNFLIYLKPDTQLKILKTFYFSLKKDQFLVLGPSESPGELQNVFQYISHAWNIYQKQETNERNVRHTYKTNIGWKPFTLKDAPSHAAFEPPLPEFSDDLRDPFSEYLLKERVPKVMFVDEKLDILYLNGDLEDILAMPKAMVKMNLENLVDEAAALFFRDGVRLAKQDKEIHSFKNTHFDKDSNSIYAHVFFQKVNLPQISSPIYMITFDYQEEPHTSDLKVINELNYDTSSHKEARIFRLENELKEKAEDIEVMKSQIDLTAEELKTSHQELMASNEELQSSNEELQSLNEELHTVNTELQYKNKELLLSNNDLSNLLKSTKIGTMFLDQELRIRKFTPLITRQFDLLESDINRPITAFSNKLKSTNIPLLCKQVMQSKQALEKQVVSNEEEPYLLRITPYQNEEKTVEGVVITVIDINKITAKKSELEELGHKFLSFIQTTEYTIMFLAPDGTITFSNKALGEYGKDELVERNIFRILDSTSVKKLKEALTQLKRNRREQVLDDLLISSNGGIVESYSFRVGPVPNRKDGTKLESFSLLALNTTKYND